MALIVIELSGSTAKLKGQLSRRLLEIARGLFVGSVSKRTLEVLWEAIVESNPKHATLVFPAKNEIGCDFKVIGAARYDFVSNYGLPLLRYTKKSVHN